MTEKDDDIQTSLAPPGAGLPAVQGFVLRRLLFPLFCRTTLWEKSLALFRDEGDRILALLEGLSDNQLQQRVLIKAPIGLEDSSRYWSPAMVLEHLIEVGTRVATGVVMLSHGEQVPGTVSTADVKPAGGKDSHIIDEYKAFLLDYVHTITEDVGDRRSRTTHFHPWFGHLNTHHWVCLGGMHQRVHRYQMERIVAGLQ